MNFLKNPRSQKIFLAIFFVIFAIFAQFFQNNFSIFSQKSTEDFSQKNSYAETLRDETRAKVLQILEDAEVQKTLKRIENSDEYYRKDGAIFMNREKKLPVKSDKNYYSEWTVKTPSEKDRGARRVVAGKGGELYFTDDHYLNFTRIR